LALGNGEFILQDKETQFLQGTYLMQGLS
jgi:hypothetical protein